MENISEFKPYSRKIIGLERYFYRRPNPNVVMIARFRGNVTEEQLRTALEKAARRHPLLRVRVRQENGGEAFFTGESVGGFPIEVIEGEKTESEMLDRKIAEEVQILHDLERGPLIRFILFRSGDASDILVNCHHMACDGLSLAYLLRELYVLLGEPGGTLEPVGEPVKVGEALPTKAGVSWYHNILIRSLNKKWSRKNILFTDRDHKRLYNKFWKAEAGLNVMHWSLDGKLTDDIIRRCRREGITVHSALCTAFLLAQNRVQGDAPYLRNISMPVSIRNRLSRPAGEAFGLYFSSFKVAFKAPGENNFWDNARAVHGHVCELMTDRNIFMIFMQLKDLHPTLVDSISFTRYDDFRDRLADRFYKLEGGYTLDTGMDLSNLGLVEMPESVGHLKFTGFVGPSCYNEFQEKYTGVVTAGGKMHFTITHRDRTVSTGDVVKLKELAMKYLADALNDSTNQ